MMMMTMMIMRRRMMRMAIFWVKISARNGNL
jgi:hypothetical protein